MRPEHFRDVDACNVCKYSIFENDEMYGINTKFTCDKHDFRMDEDTASESICADFVRGEDEGG